MSQRNTCPICRHELPTDDEAYERDRLRRRNETLKMSLPKDVDDDPEYNSMYS